MNNINQTEKVKIIKVDYLEGLHGMIEINVSLGKDTEHIRFYHVYDPIEEFIAWLEAICVGVQKCEFWFIEGVDDKRFTFECERFCYGRKLFTVAEDYHNGKILLHGYVDQYNLIEQLYTGMKTFVSSDKYDYTNYERITFYDIYKKKNNLNRDDVLSFLCQKSVDEISEILFNIGHELNPDDFIEGNYDSTTTNDKSLKKIYPDNIDSMKEKRKKIILNNILEDNIACHSGYKLSELHSEIIEKYLKENKK